MDYGKAVDNYCWYAIHTHPQQEDRASNNLVAWNVETFSPRVKKRYSNPYTGAPTFVSKPLFPRYIFARFDRDKLLSKILFTRGVHSVVGFGGVPAQINDEIITLIQAQVAEDGFIKIGEQLRIGDKVMIKAGPLRNLTGVFERNVKGRDRVLILLASINYQGSVVVEREHVGRVNTADMSFSQN